MKTLPLIGILAVFTSLLSCSESNENRIKSSVKQYISENTNDPSSYEEVSWSKIDTVFEPFSKTQEAKEMQDRMATLLKKSKKTFEEEKELINIQMVYDYKKGTRKTGGRIESYEIIHKMRGKNAFGALVLSDVKFSIDTTFKVIKAENLGLPKIEE
ncbi:hypothetical protein [Sphingobacterium sp. LRF_L2]|uniref:hypothetical protein n=1 Tax=Sphingobacterium sp. LRF_L2 TaxID=3369421 RepID=UPI003F61D1B5